MAFVETHASRRDRHGRCTGPHDGATGPGRSRARYTKATCCTCGKRVAITVRGSSHTTRRSGQDLGPTQITTLA